MNHIENNVMKLDKEGFVFIDDNSNPFLCRLIEKEPWFCRWNKGQKSWVTHKRANSVEIYFAWQRSIPKEEAEYYHKLHNKFING